MATSSSKPTLVIVPGGWHPPSAYRRFATHLEDAGYPTLTAPYPSCNSTTPKTATCGEDARSLRLQLIPLIDSEGKDVVLLSHSYGGIPAAGAAYGLSKNARSKASKKGGILGLVYMSAFAVPEGASLVEFLGGKHAPYLVPDKPSEGLCMISPAVETLYNDVNPDTANDLAASLLPHATLAFESPAPPPAWAEPAFEGKIAFLRCTQDQALPTFLQDLFVQRSGVKWIVKDIDAGHSPWASKPKETSAMVIDFAKEFGE